MRNGCRTLRAFERPPRASSARALKRSRAAQKSRVRLFPCATPYPSFVVITSAAARGICFCFCAGAAPFGFKGAALPFLSFPSTAAISNTALAYYRAKQAPQLLFRLSCASIVRYSIGVILNLNGGAIPQEAPLRLLHTKVSAAAAVVFALLFSFARGAPRAPAADDPAALAPHREV